jgi:hypothetical protein
MAQRRVLTAIEVCRTAVLGGHLEQCDHCAHQRNAYNSCSDRHCPKCQSLARAQWLADRQAELLNTQYFHVVFTLPQQIATIAYQNKRELYGILFRATAETLLTIAADPKHLGAEIGFFVVLHTWGSNLLHHPHLHCAVPGGGLSPDRTQWISCQAGFFCPSGCSQGCFVVCFWNICSKPLMPANWSFAPQWNHSGTDLHSWIIWLPCGRPNGWSTPSDLSPGLSRYWTSRALYSPSGDLQ